VNGTQNDARKATAEAHIWRKEKKRRRPWTEEEQEEDKMYLLSTTSMPLHPEP